MPKTQQEFEQKNEKAPQWLESIYENCERVGVSKQVIIRFLKYVLGAKREGENEWFSATPRGSRGTRGWAERIYFLFLFR